MFRFCFREVLTGSILHLLANIYLGNKRIKYPKISLPWYICHLCKMRKSKENWNGNHSTSMVREITRDKRKKQNQRNQLTQMGEHSISETSGCHRIDEKFLKNTLTSILSRCVCNVTSPEYICKIVWNLK